MSEQKTPHWGNADEPPGNRRQPATAPDEIYEPALEEPARGSNETLPPRYLKPVRDQLLKYLVLLFTNLLAITLASQRFFDALFLAWFQIKGVTLDLFDNVFGLNFALETAQGILERFTFLNSNLCQGKYTSQSGPDWL